MGIMELLAAKGAKFFKGYSEYFLKDPEKAQGSVLDDIIKRNKTTTFGKQHGFDLINSIRDYQKRCPVRSYKDFKPYINQILSGNRNTLSNDRLLYLGQSSGTTGKPKLIPVTSKTLLYYSLGLLRIASFYIDENPREHAGIINGKWLNLPAPAVLRYQSGIPIGYITGQNMLASGTEFWRHFLKLKSYAPLHLMHIKDVELKFKKVFDECKTKNITALIGVTSVIVNLLDYFLKFSGKEKIIDIFPNLQFALFSGVPPEFYKSRLQKLIGRDIAIREEYAATESVIGTQLSANKGFTPLHDKVFFEFVPTNESEERVLLHDVKKGKEYRVVITTQSGLYGYDMGDVVKFVSTDPPRFIFSFRTNVIDLADEKLTPSQVHAAIKLVNEQQGCKVNDFCMIGTYDPKPHYIFAIEFDPNHHPKADQKYLSGIDAALETVNDIYYQNRRGSNKGTLSPPELWQMKEGTFLELEKRKGLEGSPVGQAKSTKVTKDKKLLNFFNDRVKNIIAL